MQDESSESIERALERAATAQPAYVLRLYVAGNSPRSQRAVRNLRRLCDRYLDQRSDVEVIDIYKDREQAFRQQVLGAPTLVKEQPLPLRRLIGDLSDEARVLAALNLGQADEAA